MSSVDDQMGIDKVEFLKNDNTELDKKISRARKFRNISAGIGVSGYVAKRIRTRNF